MPLVVQGEIVLVHKLNHVHRFVNELVFCVWHDDDGTLDEDSLRALENVIRQATQLLEAARPKKRRKTGGH